jgi:GcrA cell cycle regulator
MRDKERWTPERVVRLRVLWEAGRTAEEIAAELGVSRSAIIGKIHRLRLQAASATAKSNGQQGKATPHECAQPDLAAQSEIPLLASLLETPPARRRKRRPSPPTKLNGAAKPQRKTLFDLDNRSCRWPLGTPGTPSFRFCCNLGANLERGVIYCPKHRARAYTTQSRNEKEDF